MLVTLQTARQEDGSSLIELAIVLPFVMLIVFSMVDYAFFIQKAIQVQDAASAGASFGAIPGNSGNSATMIQLANFDATGSLTGATGFVAKASDFYTCTPGGAQVTATYSCPTGAPFHYVQVTTSLTATSLLAYPGVPRTQTINGSAIYRVEVTP
jgi:Flp pilus assembly protein TadG